MTVPQVIELLLNRMNTRQQFVAGTFAALGGTAGSLQMQQRDVNAAILLWQQHQDSSGLQQVTKVLHAYGNLTDQEYEQIMETLDGEK